MNTIAEQVRQTITSEYKEKGWTRFYYRDIMPKDVSEDAYEEALFELEKEGFFEIRGLVLCPACEKETWEGPILEAKAWDRQCNSCELNCLADAGITSDDLEVIWKIDLDEQKVPLWWLFLIWEEGRL